jgi:Cu/Ag efflux pump CusA
MALAIRAGFLLGNRIRAEEAKVPHAPVERVVAAVARERAVPLTQSLLASAALLLPAALAGTRPGLEFLHPMAVTMLGGLASLLVVQALVLPAFLVVAARQKREHAPAETSSADQPGTARPATVN